MLNSASMTEEIHRLRLENRELRQSRALSTLIERGLGIILEQDTTEQIFSHFFGVLQQAMPFSLGLFLNQPSAGGPWQLVSATADVPAEVIDALQQCLAFDQRTENVFNLHLFEAWQGIQQNPWAHLHALIGVRFSDAGHTHVLLLLYDEVGAYTQTELDMLDGFILFANNTMSQFERRELIGRQHEMELRQRSIEQTLIQSEKMASLGQMAAGVAHEINNPMSYIISNLDNLDYNLEQLFKLLVIAPIDTRSLPSDLATIDLNYLQQDTHDIMREMREGGQRIKDIVQGLKQFAHPDQSQISTIDLQALIDSTLKIAWNEIKYKAKVDFTPPQQPVHITGRAAQLSQVLINLFINAAQAIDAQQGLIEVTLRQDRDAAVLAIKDNGCGIHPDALRKVFDPFYTTKPVGSGTGLGLAISKAIVEQHQGRIEVNSEVGKGTCFTLTLPRSPDLKDSLPLML